MEEVPDQEDREQKVKDPKDQEDREHKAKEHKGHKGQMHKDPDPNPDKKTQTDQENQVFAEWAT